MQAELEGYDYPLYPPPTPEEKQEEAENWIQMCEEYGQDPERGVDQNAWYSMYEMIDSNMAARLDFYRQHLLQAREIGPVACEQIRAVARQDAVSGTPDYDPATVASAQQILSEYKGRSLQADALSKMMTRTS